MQSRQSDKILLEVLRGEKTGAVPFWFMRQAGRYLPEYRELRAEKGGFLAMAFDPKSAAEITLQPVRRFGMHGAIIFSDILVVPYALGQALEFQPGEGPLLGNLALSELSFEKFETTLEPVFEALSGVRTALRTEGFSDTALIGFAGAPWTVAAYMIEGHGGTGFPKAVAQAKNADPNFSALIDLLIDATTRYLIAQVEAGAEALQLFESWAGLLQGAAFEKYVIAPSAKIVAGVKAKYPDIPIIGFPRAAGELYIPYVGGTGIDVVGVDQQVDTGWARDNLQARLPVQGNLDPALLIAGGDTLVKGANAILEAFSGGPHVFNLGHGVGKDTPPEHVELLCLTIRDFKR